MPWQGAGVNAPAPLPSIEPVEITAGRLHLRPFRPGDADAVHDACQDPLVQRWTRVPVPYGREDARAFVEDVSPEQWRSGSGAGFAVLDATTAELLASVGIFGISARDRLCEMGVWCAPHARGRGVTSEAVAVVCRWAFGALGLRRVEWLAAAANTASQRTALRAGMQVEGVLRNRLDLRGEVSDAWVASMVPGDLGLT